MTTARRIALLIIAALFGYGMAPEPQPAAKAATVVVGSPPGVEAQLRTDLADAREEIAVLRKELTAARLPPVPEGGDFRKPEANAAQPAAETKRVVYQYQPQPRRGLFGRRR